MKKTMRDFISEQPEAIRTVIREVPIEIQKVLDVAGTDYRTIFLIGSGTSLNAAYAVQAMFERYTSASVRVMTPFDFLHYYPDCKINSGYIVFGISQTARSTGTIDAIKKARRLGAMTVFVTAEPENEGAGCAHIVFNTHTGEELVGAKTKGYTTTMAAMFMLAASFAGKTVDLNAMPGIMQKVLEATEMKMLQLVKEFTTAPAFTIVGYGPCISNVKEGGLKMLETVRVPVETYDVEEYMHGPYHCLDENSRLIFLAPEGNGQSRMAQLINFCEEITKHTLVLGNQSFVSAIGKNFKVAFPDAIPEELAPLSYVIPMQCMANDITLNKGRKPEASSYPNFHKMLGSKFMPKINYYTGQ